ncbi:hypothetical protein [Trichothermofontia sp.]
MPKTKPRFVSDWDFFCATFVGVLIYASLSGDKTLPDRFITLSLGALGGGVGVVIFRKNSPPNDRP